MVCKGEIILLTFLLNIIKGAVIGVANVIPGVSGGTMMVSMGIYDDIIESINGLFKHFKKSIVTLLPYVIGMAVGIVGFARAIEFLFGKFPIPTALLFIGLIFGGIPMMWKRATKKKIDVVSVLLFILFFALVIGLQFLGNVTSVDKSLDFSVLHMIVGFLIGVVAAATMIIPGVSGSMVMMVLGYYNTIISAINDLIASLLSFDISGILKGMGRLVPFGIGVIVGIFAVAKLIKWLLDNHEAKTYCAILGLIVASPYPVFVNAGISSVSLPMILIGVVTFALGLFGAYKLGEK
jgi:putative membrane protein